MKIIFLILLENISLVFATKSTLIIYNISVIPLEISIILVFVVTAYKFSGFTFSTTIIDLNQNTKLGNKGLNQKFCSIYIQLLSLHILHRLHFLQSAMFDDIEMKLYLMLLE